MFKKVLITGSGRCGSNSLAQFLDGMKYVSGELVVAHHETNRVDFLEKMKNKKWDSVLNFLANDGYPIEVSPYISLLPENLNKEALLFALIRDGRDTIRSGMNSGWFLNLSKNNTSYYELLPNFKGDRFEKCCQLWVWVYKKLELWGAIFIKLENLRQEKGASREMLFDKLEIVSNNKPFPVTNLALSRKRIITESGHPELPCWEQWTPSQKGYFIESCGNLMNKYYPEIILNR